MNDKIQEIMNKIKKQLFEVDDVLGGSTNKCFNDLEGSLADLEQELYKENKDAEILEWIANKGVCMETCYGFSIGFYDKRISTTEILKGNIKELLTKATKRGK
jgi:hypothetical protein